MKKKDYIIPALVIARLRPVKLLQTSGDLTNNGDDTSGDADDDEEFEGLFD